MEPSEQFDHSNMHPDCFHVLEFLGQIERPREQPPQIQKKGGAPPKKVSKLKKTAPKVSKSKIEQTDLTDAEMMDKFDRIIQQNSDPTKLGEVIASMEHIEYILFRYHPGLPQDAYQIGMTLRKRIQNREASRRRRNPYF